MNLYLSSLGIVNALGCGPREVLDGALRGCQSGLQPIKDLATEREMYFGQVPTQLDPIDPRLSKYDCRNNRILLQAYRQIETEVQALLDKFGPERIGVVLGSSTSGIREVEDALETKLRTGAYPPSYFDYKQEMGTVAEFLAEFLQLSNVALTVSTACSSSGKVFYTARNLIEVGVCEAVLVGGVDSLCRLTANGFAALGAMSQGLSNPFSLNRDGINIGEGSALFILGKEESEIALKGVGESSDAHHISAPHPEGVGAEQAMRAALKDAGLKPDDISYINLHGTGTEQNDLMESRAVHRVFGSQLPCSSTKALTGHTLGAAGAVEAGLCWLTLSALNQKREVPPHVWDGVVDEALEPLCLAPPQTTLDSTKPQNLMSNSFAFGGSNVSVVIGRP